jgi:hypothetical protein
VVIFGTLPDCSLLHVDALTARTDNQASLFRSIPVKQSARPSRTPSKLSDSVHRQLSMYALVCRRVRWHSQQREGWCIIRRTLS